MSLVGAGEIPLIEAWTEDLETAGTMLSQA
jgi:hypothetical protein